MPHLNWTRTDGGFYADIDWPSLKSSGKVMLHEQPRIELESPHSDFVVKANINGHHYETRFHGTPISVRDQTNCWLQKVIATRGQDAKEVSN